MIRAEGISVSFGEKSVLDGLSLSVHDHTTTVIMGRSGIGKSVLLKCLSGLLFPDFGRIFIDEEEITGVPRKERERITAGIGMVFQEGALFDSMTVFENIAFPLVYRGTEEMSDIEKKVMHYAELVEMEHSLSLYPGELSGGMKRKAALARAAILEPRYLFYDEPTSGLDPESSAVVEMLIRRMQSELKVTSLIITHDIELARFIGTHIALLENGKITSFQEKAYAFSEDSLIWENFLSSRERLHYENGF